MKRVLFAAYEAGGAEVVSSWLRHQQGISPFFLLEGPAVAVFRRKLGEISVLSREQAFAGISGFDEVITGTGMGPAIELTTLVIERAKACGVPVHSYLDHWVNYRERFEFRGRLVVPDEIWVGDKAAESRAKDVFGSLPVRLEPNRYFMDLASEIGRLKPAPAVNGIRVLYLADPADPAFFGYTEFDAIEGYFRHLSGCGEKVSAVRLRLHPSEAAGKYQDVVKRAAPQFEVVESGNHIAPLSEDIAWADWVVGCDTMALVIGVHAGKRVFSCIPRGGRPMSLPYPAIERIFPG